MKFNEIFRSTDEYYQQGSIDELILSSSAYNALDVETGGSPSKFVSFFDRTSIPVSVAMENGTLIHEYVEHRNKFEVADFELPGEKMIEWVQALITENVSMSDENIIQVKEAYGLYKNIKNRETAINTFNKTGRQLYDFIKAGETKHVIKNSTRELIDTVYNKLEEHSFAYELLFAPLTLEGYERIKEKAIYFTLNGLPHKAKIDNFIIDHDNKKIKLTDLKTSNINPYKYVPLFNLNTEDSLSKYLYLTKFTFYSRKTFRQLYIYGEALKSIYPEYSIEYYIVLAQTKEPYDVVCYQFSPTLISHIALIDIKSLQEQIKYHQREGFESSIYETNGRIKHGF